MTKREELLQRISINPNVCFGRACVRGTRIWVSLIVDNLAEGVPEAELLQAYPQLQPEDISFAWCDFHPDGRRTDVDDRDNAARR